MQKALAIARREIEERSFVFITAVVLTLAPALALIVPRGTFHDRLSTFGVLSLILAVGFTGGLAITLGASLVGRELTEKRISFYFSRPVTGAQIWFGKLTAALAILMVCMVVVFLPSVFFFRSVASSWVVFPFLVAEIIAGSLFLLLMGHTMSTIFRARSAWIALDFAAAVAFKIALFTALVPLMLHHASGDVMLAIAFVALVFILIVAFGGARQLSRGRIDVRRNHRELSKVLWISLAVVLILVYVAVLWVTAIGPHDLKHAWPRSAPAGTWTYIEGWAQNRGDFVGAFFYDVATGASIEVPMQHVWSGQFDRSGTAAVWVEPANPIGMLIDQGLSQRRMQPMELVVSRLEANAKPKHTGIFLNGSPAYSEVTSDLSRVAVIAGGTLTVYDVNTRASLASVQVGDAYTRFVSPDVIRIVAFTANHVKRAQELDLRTRAVKTLFEVNDGQFVMLRLGGDDRTLIVHAWRGGSVPYRFIDLATGRDLPAPALNAEDSVDVIHDGHIVVARAGHVLVYSGATLQRDIAIDASSPRLESEREPGKILVWDTKPRNTSFVVDLDRGAVVGGAKGVVPVGHAIFRDLQGRLVTWDGKPIL